MSSFRFDGPQSSGDRNEGIPLKSHDPRGLFGDPVDGYR